MYVCMQVAKQEPFKQASSKVHAEAANLRHQLEVVQSQLSTVQEEKRSLETDIASLTKQVAAKGLKVLGADMLVSQWPACTQRVGQLWA